MHSANIRALGICRFSGSDSYYVLATRNGFKLFSHERKDLRLSDDEHENRMKWKDLRRRMKRKPRDLLHAFFSSAVFTALAFCNAEVQACLVPTETWQWKKFLTILPLAVGFLASFVFSQERHRRRRRLLLLGHKETRRCGSGTIASPGHARMSTIRVASSTSYQLDPVV